MLSVALSLIPAEAETAGRYPAPLFRGARTFLVRASSPAAARPSGGGDIVALLAPFESVVSVRFWSKAETTGYANRQSSVAPWHRRGGP